MAGRQAVLETVATALTVYGIETTQKLNFTETSFMLQQLLPFTVLKRLCTGIYSQYLSNAVATALTVYGIETIKIILIECQKIKVATALTVYGIETAAFKLSYFLFNCMLQQLLPFTVLKQTVAVSKRSAEQFCNDVATALTVYGIETGMIPEVSDRSLCMCCNSSYRLRY